MLGSAGLAVFRSNDEDPYITLPDADDDSENDEETIIRPTDALILACHSEEDGHTLDVYVYDDEEGSLFVHHDLMLNAFPLCVTWMDTARTNGAPGTNLPVVVCCCYEMPGTHFGCVFIRELCSYRDHGHGDRGRAAPTSCYHHPPLALT